MSTTGRAALRRPAISPPKERAITNPFMTLAHCSRFAVRKAFHTGNPQHVIATFVSFVPYLVLDDHRMLARSDIDLADILFTADPFDGDTANVVPLRLPD